VTRRRSCVRYVRRRWSPRAPVGRFSLRDVLIATGQLSAPASGDGVPEVSTIDAAAMDVDLEKLQPRPPPSSARTSSSAPASMVLTEKVGVARAAT